MPRVDLGRSCHHERPLCCRGRAPCLVRIHRRWAGVDHRGGSALRVGPPLGLHKHSRFLARSTPFRSAFQPIVRCERPWSRQRRQPAGPSRQRAASWRSRVLTLPARCGNGERRSTAALSRAARSAPNITESAAPASATCPHLAAVRSRPMPTRWGPVPTPHSRAAARTPVRCTGTAQSGSSRRHAWRQ